MTRDSTPRQMPNRNVCRCFPKDVHKNVHSSIVCNKSKMDTLNVHQQWKRQTNLCCTVTMESYAAMRMMDLQLHTAI